PAIVQREVEHAVIDMCCDRRTTADDGRRFVGGDFLERSEEALVTAVQHVAARGCCAVYKLAHQRRERRGEIGRIHRPFQCSTSADSTSSTRPAERRSTAARPPSSVSGVLNQRSTSSSWS